MKNVLRGRAINVESFFRTTDCDSDFEGSGVYDNSSESIDRCTRLKVTFGPKTAVQNNTLDETGLTMNELRKQDDAPTEQKLGIVLLKQSV